MEDNVARINGGIMTNVHVNIRNVMYVTKIVWSSTTCNCENRKYSLSFMDDSPTIFAEIIESHNAEANFKERKKESNL